METEVQEVEQGRRAIRAWALAGVAAVLFAAGAYGGVGGANDSGDARDGRDAEGKVTRSWLGISVQTVDTALADAMDLKADEGAILTSVTQGGPGDKAGLRRGDVILRLDDMVIRDAAALRTAVGEAKPGKEIDLTLMRGIKTLEISVRVVRMRNALASKGNDGVEHDGADRDEVDGNADANGDVSHVGQKARLGLKVSEPDRALRRLYHTGPGTGVVVLGVEEGSRAEAAGLQQGDFILEAGNRPVATAEALRDAVAIGRKKGKLVLRVKRGEEVFYAAVRFG